MTTPSDVLQWGRGEIPRKGGKARKGTVLMSELQWGRGEIPRKGSPGMSKQAITECFNGAAVRYRGKALQPNR